MKLSYSSLKDEDVFTLTDFQCSPAQKILERNGLYKILWNRAENVELRIDDYRVSLKKNEVVFCTPLNLIEVPQDNEGIVAFVFNKQFFCIQTHDDQVSCHGFLFFGSAQPQFIKLSKDDLSHFELMHQLFLKDLNFKDHLQGEMLRSLLKRLLVTSTRLLRENMPDPSIKQNQLDLIREFNILVEKHFKEYHKVLEFLRKF